MTSNVRLRLATNREVDRVTIPLPEIDAGRAPASVVSKLKAPSLSVVTDVEPTLTVAPGIGWFESVPTTRPVTAIVVGDGVVGEEGVEDEEGEDEEPPHAVVRHTSASQLTRMR